MPWGWGRGWRWGFWATGLPGWLRWYAFAPYYMPPYYWLPPFWFYPPWWW